MSWNNLTIGKKITASFGLVLMLLVVLGLLNFFGVGGMEWRGRDVFAANCFWHKNDQRGVNSGRLCKIFSLACRPDRPYFGYF